MANPRISGRVGQPVDLDVTFSRNGVATDPFAIRRVEIYAGSVSLANLIETITFVDPDDPTYPSPAIQFEDSTGILPGKFRLEYDVPCGVPSPSQFFDVWFFISQDPATSCDGIVSSGSEVDLDNPDLLLNQCNRFWVFPDGWFLDDMLETVRFGFEPLDVKFRAGEVRTLEVGVTPLPLNDFNWNLIMPMIPFFQATITIQTQNCEILLKDAPMKIGLRQGSFRSNPFVLQFLFDTAGFLINTYRYNVTITLPNGEVRISPNFFLSVQ